MTRASRTSGSAPPSTRRAGRAKIEKIDTAARRASAAEKRERVDVQETLRRFEKAADAVQRGDSWQNAITGLGVAGRDWTTATTLTSDAILSRQQTDDLYAQDNLAARMVDGVAEDAIRNWFELVGMTGEAELDFQRKIFAHTTRLQAKKRLMQWMKLGRKDGGGVLLIGADDGRALDQELDLDAVTEIRHLHHLEKWSVLPDTIDTNPMSSNFGRPLLFRILPRPISVSNYSDPSRQITRGKSREETLLASGSVLVHFSRVIAYEGVQVSERRKQLFRGWGYSVLQRCFWSIQNYRLLWAHLQTVFKHLSQTVVQFAGYAEMSANDFQKAIQTRLRNLQMARSTLNIIPLDAEDKLTEQTLRGLNGALEILKYAQEELAQAADMPLTKLFGHMPQGFSKDDDAGRDNWHARVAGAQEDYLLEPITNLITMIAQVYKIPTPDSWSVSFLPIDVPDDLAAAEIDLKEAMASDLRIKNATIDPEESRDALRVDPRCRYPLKAGPAKGEAATHNIERAKLENQVTIAEMAPDPAPPTGGPPGSNADAYEEGKHPRGKGGKWVSSGSDTMRGTRGASKDFPRTNSGIVNALERAIEHDFGTIDFADTRIKDVLSSYLSKETLAKATSFDAAVLALVSEAKSGKDISTWSQFAGVNLGGSRSSVVDVLREVGVEIGDEKLARASLPGKAIEQSLNEEQAAHYAQLKEEHRQRGA